MKRFSAIRAVSCAGVSAIAISAAASTAQAQSVDYGALEQLYGEPVTTSATGKPQKASEAPANMIIISADDIRRSGANNIPDILRFVTGIDVRRYSAGQADVAVHGYNQPGSPRLLVMVNGRQIYVDIYGFVVWSLIPVQLEEIRQIEVVKGPNSALFGFNAASGVINIITYDPLFDQTNTATVRFGTQALLEGSAVATAHIGDNAGVRMSVGGLQQHDYNQLANFPSIPTGRGNTDRGAFNIDGKARVTPDVEVTLEASTVTAQENDLTPPQFPEYEAYHTNSFKAGVTADTAWGLMALSAYRNWLGLSVNPSFIGDQVITNTIYVLQGSDTVRLDADNIMRIGLEYRNNASTSTYLLHGTTGYAVYSASAMWDWQITPKVSFTNSARIDYLALNYSGTLTAGSGYTNSQYNNTTIAQPSFNSGLVYKVTDQDTVRLTAGRGLQVPSLADFGLQVPAVAGLRPATIGSPTLQPTAVWNLELGYDRGVPAINSVVRTSVFVQRNDSLLTSGLSTLPQLISPALVASESQNTGYSDAIGGELGIDGHSTSGFRWNASYAFEVVHDHTTNNNVFLTSPQNYQDGTPTSVVILGGGYTWDKLEIDAQGRWQSRFTDYIYTVRGLAPAYVSDYLTTLVRVGYNVTDHLTLAVTGQQLNVPRLMQTGGVPPIERSVIASATVHF